MDPALSDQDVFFGPFRLSPAAQALYEGDRRLRVGGRAFEILLALTQRAGELVSKEDLVARVWPNLHVDDAALRVHISALRKALSDDPGAARYILNVAGRGYRFIAPLARAPDEEVAIGPARTAGPPGSPASSMRIIGRDVTIHALVQSVPQRHFVTITGPGGIGKTTVALAVAEQLANNYCHDVAIVDLTSLADPQLVPSTVASGLQLQVSSRTPVADLVALLQRRQMLLVLDNCEHVIEVAALLGEQILAGAPGVHILTTSREPLRAAGEWVYRLPPLELPPQSSTCKAADVLTSPAVLLFAERARAANDTFVLTDADAPSVAEICRRLDGIPLAIELAAARVDLFGIQGLASHLNDCFALLTSGRRTALPRHRTLRATLDWSHQLLPEHEQLVFRRLAVFRGSFTLEAAAAVAWDAGEETPDLLDGIANLVAKSLLAAAPLAGTAQYRLLETTRAYAAEKLAQGSDAELTARRYATYHRDLMRRGEAERKAHSSAGWLSIYGSSIDDVRAAIDWAFTPAGDLSIGLDLTAASAPLWFQLSLMPECRERTERALQRLQEAPEPDAALEMRLQAALGHAIWYAANDLDTMERAFARALAIAKRIGDILAQLQALWGLWAVRRGRGEFRTALALATEYEVIAREVGDSSSILLGDRILGLTNHFLGNQNAARRLTEHVRNQARRTDHASNIGFQLDSEVATAALLSRILWLQGFPDQAAAAAREAIDAAQQGDHWFSICYALYFAGCPLSLWTGDLVEAQHRVGILVDRAAGNPIVDTWIRYYSLILRLRQGSDRDSLIASFIELRMEFSRLTAVETLVPAAANQLPPLPEAEPSEALWSLPEILRVDAELSLSHGASDAAEAKLLRSLDLARQQSALSWELRSATSLARLWHSGGRAAEARDLLATTYDRFTEGFSTGDLVAARRLIADWS